MVREGKAWAAARAWYARIPVGAVLRPFLTVTGLVAAYYQLPLSGPFSAATLTALVLGLICVTALFAWHMRAVSHSHYPRLRAVEAMASTVALFLLLFATVYYLLEQNSPQSFTEHLGRTDALYYTLTVFTTVGFGDITARPGTPRVLTMVQMVGNLVVLGVAGRVLVQAIQTGLHRKLASEHPTPASEPDRPTT